ncbi:MAG: hypothetical protein K6L76_08775 [Agarilytica sp.]
MSNKAIDHILEELEEQYHSIHDRIVKVKDDYVKSHAKDHANARKKVESAKKKLDAAKDRFTKASKNAKEKGTKTAHVQKEKAKAALAMVKEGFVEAKDIMLTAESKLNSAKPVEKKLAARAKALAAFEREWAKKEKEEEKKKAKRAAERKKKAAAKRKASTKPAPLKAAPRDS